MNIIDIKEYSNEKNPRLIGFIKLQSVGLRVPAPLKIVTNDAFAKFKKNKEFPGGIKTEIEKAFREMIKGNEERGLIARRAYVVPGIDNPPGPRSAKIGSAEQLIDEIGAIFKFAINNGFDKEGAEIAAFFHPIINPVLPQSGGCITPSKDNSDEVVIEAIYGNDEGVQSFPHDTYIVDIRSDNIVGKFIQNKNQCLLFTEDFKIETIDVPEELQNVQVVSDLNILNIAKEFEKLIDSVGPSRVEFDILDKEGVYYIEWSQFIVKKTPRKEIETSGEVLRVKDIADVERVKKNNKIIFIDSVVIQGRNMDILTTLAYNLAPGSIVLYPGSATTAHAATIFRELGHTLVFVRTDKFETGEYVEIGLRQNHIVAKRAENKELPLTILLSKINKKQFAGVGNKAVRLNELNSVGFNVPRSFSITTAAFEKHLDESDLIVKVERLGLDKPRDDLAKRAEEIRAEILDSKISNQLSTSLLEAVDKIGSDIVAVRSSATAEDLANASFAGQFESFLNVSKKDFLKKVKETWASVYTKNVSLYAFANQIPMYSIKMAVLVMEMIDAEKAGVMFTKDIVGDKDDIMIIEGTEGLGDKVVDGTVEPDRVIINKLEENVLRRNGEESLTDEDIEKLISVGKQIEDYYKRPQDIEWAIKDDKVWVLQTRPITT